MQIFHRSANAIAKASILGLVLLVGSVLTAVGTINISAYATKQNVVQDQPVPFSHTHHVAGLGIDCRYCHQTVEETAFAGIPPTATCMNCHSQIWTNAEILEPVRRSYETGTPIQWTRIHDLPDFVKFNHSIHVNKGVGCVSCHGRVDQMPLMRQTKPMTMQWCLDCHRDPQKNLRPKEHVFDLAWEPEEDQKTLGARLAREYKVREVTNCSACHY